MKRSIEEIQQAERYFYEQKYPDIYWSEPIFSFYADRNPNLDPHQVIEKILQISRNNLQEIVPISRETQNLIAQIDDYFQAAFAVALGILAPVSIKEVTHFTSRWENYADTIGRKTFIDQATLQNKRAFVHLAIHEALHLCFPGFSQKPIEEGFIEYLIEKMFHTYPSGIFPYSPVSQAYAIWKENIRTLFEAIPELENHFLLYITTQNIPSLRQYLKKHFTAKIRAQMEHSGVRNIELFLQQIDSFCNAER